MHINSCIPTFTILGENRRDYTPAILADQAEFTINFASPIAQAEAYLRFDLPRLESDHQNTHDIGRQ